MPQTSFLREYYMEVIKLNQLNNYGVSERFFTEATLYPEYQLARVIAQYRGKYKIVTEQGEMLARFPVNFGMTLRGWPNIRRWETV